MQIEWSPGRNDEHMNGLFYGAAPAERLLEDVTAADGPDSYDTVPVITAEIDDGMAGEEEAHRFEVDAVDLLLDEVELAMARLDDGTYGRCETCGTPIDDVELALTPLVRECTPCSTGALAFEDA